MANLERSNILEFVDKRVLPNAVTVTPTTIGNYKDIASLRARLFAISATSYSVARLDSMTENDMVYALRLNDDPTGI